MKKVTLKPKINLKTLLGKPDSLYEKFHHKTKNNSFAHHTSVDKWPAEWKNVYYKGYARLPEIVLPKPKLAKKISLEKSLTNRQSTRDFSSQPLSLSEISTIFYFSAGKKNVTESRKNRFYPSPGSRYPLEVYFLSLNSKLPKGLYHYYVKSNSLEQLLLLDNFKTKEYYNLPWVQQASGIILITAVFKRNVIKYGNRGYRQIMLECGHLGQNFYLTASALDLGVCTVDGFLDDKFNELLDIDGLNESIIYTMVIGHK